MENKNQSEIAQAVECKLAELETCDPAALTEALNIVQTVEDLARRVDALENRPANERPNDIDIVARIDVKLAPGDDADVIDTIAEISDGGDGDVRIDVGDTTIWLPRPQLSAALNVIYGGRD